MLSAPSILTAPAIDAPRLDRPGSAARRRPRDPSKQASPVRAVDRDPGRAGRPARNRRADHPGRGDLLLYAMLGLLVAAAWQVSRLKLFRPNDDVSYWIAVAGGTMMLALFSYPLRKYVRFMQRLGQVKWWFWTHLFLGIAGPWLILVHSSFQIGSLNAGVALYSMVIVVISGVVGRFIYVRVNRGLNGERMSLDELRERAGLVESDARSRLHFAPLVEARLLAFEQRELRAGKVWVTAMRRVALLPLLRWVAYRHCVTEARSRLRSLAIGLKWSEQDLRQRERRAVVLIDRYLEAVVRVAQYSAYERLFALWHLAHLPFVYLLVISAVVHVIAVHAY